MQIQLPVIWEEGYESMFGIESLSQAKGNWNDDVGCSYNAFIRQCEDYSRDLMRLEGEIKNMRVMLSQAVSEAKSTIKSAE